MIGVLVSFMSYGSDAELQQQTGANITTCSEKSAEAVAPCMACSQSRQYHAAHTAGPLQSDCSKAYQHACTLDAFWPQQRQHSIQIPPCPLPAQCADVLLGLEQAH
jgi:hypothetical protein